MTVNLPRDRRRELVFNRSSLPEEAVLRIRHEQRSARMFTEAGIARPALEPVHVLVSVVLIYV